MLFYITLSRVKAAEEKHAAIWVPVKRSEKVIIVPDVKDDIKDNDCQDMFIDMTKPGAVAEEDEDKPHMQVGLLT